MIPVAEIKNGIVLNVDGQLLKVLSYEMHGAAKAGRVLHAKLKNCNTGVVVDRSFRADDKVEDLPLESARMEFLYKEGEHYIFMNLTNYEQLTISGAMIGPGVKFLKPNSELSVESCDGKPISVIMPRFVEAKVSSTPPGISGQADTTFKEALLENGAQVMVPQFIKEGDLIKVEPETGRYLDRVVTK